MDHQYPYIQTFQNIDGGISVYAIQPISENEAITLPEENPILGFGPLGKVNIFVGATNAGKSRFLRMVAKSATYNFYTSSQAQEAISTMLICARRLATSDESLRFHIHQGDARMMDGTAAALFQLPSWAQEALKGVQPAQDYDLTLNSGLFYRYISFFEKFISDQIVKPKSSVRSGEIPIDLEMVLWAKNLFQGEIEARCRDEVEKQNTRIHFTNQLESFTAQRSSYITFDVDSLSSSWRDDFVRLWNAFDYLIENVLVEDEQPPQRIYIPTLRSAVSLKDESGKRLNYDIFARTVIQNYQLNETGLEVFTGNTLYSTLRRDRNGTSKVISRLREFEKFLGAAFYEGRNIEIVPLDEAFESGQHINVRVQDEPSRDLHDLGDGINTLVILLYQLFMAEPESWVFIEEPELNLHPGLQRVFLQTLLENEALRKRNLRVFFTTHSNHLLRMTLRDGTIAASDISVFAFQQRAAQKDRFLIRPLISEHHDALALLGVQNASVLLAQCGVWVEGVTDRQYLRAYLNAYQNSAEFKKAKLKTMREDTHFAFWEYAGSNLAHYLMSDIPRKGTAEAEEYERGKKEVLSKIESSALCNRIFLLADRDERKSKKHDALNALAQGRSNFVYLVTPCIEIENLLSPDEIVKCLPDFLKGTHTSISFAYSQADYKDTRMGEFLKEKFPTGCPNSWVADSGTLETNRKNRLCELAVKYVTWDSMSKEAKAVTKSLHKFISQHNEI